LCVLDLGLHVCDLQLQVEYNCRHITCGSLTVSASSASTWNIYGDEKLSEPNRANFWCAHLVLHRFDCKLDHVCEFNVEFRVWEVFRIFYRRLHVASIIAIAINRDCAVPSVDRWEVTKLSKRFLTNDTSFRCAIAVIPVIPHTSPRLIYSRICTGHSSAEQEGRSGY
jgi:hypothetical protein